MNSQEKLAYRYIFGELTETQFHWWVVKEGFDEKAMHALVGELRLKLRRAVLQFVVAMGFIITGLVLVLYSWYL